MSSPRRGMREANTEELLVDDGWKSVEVEPEAVEVHTNGNGRDEALEPQQSLFSWAEFLAEELMKPKARRSKPSPRPSPCSSGHSTWSKTSSPLRHMGGHRCMCDGLPCSSKCVALFAVSS